MNDINEVIEKLTNDLFKNPSSYEKLLVQNIFLRGFLYSSDCLKESNRSNMEYLSLKLTDNNQKISFITPSEDI